MLTDRQTKQTNNDDYITSLAEVIKCHSMRSEAYLEPWKLAICAVEPTLNRVLATLHLDMILQTTHSLSLLFIPVIDEKSHKTSDRQSMNKKNIK